LLNACVMGCGQGTPMCKSITNQGRIV